MTSHVKTEDLALLAEGLLDDEAEESVHVHVAECERCTAQLAAVKEVPQVLAAIDVPALSEDTMGRIDQALREESQRQGMGDTTAPSIHEVSNVTPLRKRTGLTRWAPYLAAAAAAVFVIGGGAAAVQGAFSSGPDTLAAPDTSSEAAPPQAIRPYQPVMLATGTDYSEEELSGQSASVIESAGLEQVEGGAEPQSSAEPLPTPSQAPAGIGACVHRLSAESEKRPVLIDVARYEGDAAWIMVFDSSSEPTEAKYDVWVVSPGCGSADQPDDAILARTTV